MRRFLRILLHCTYVWVALSGLLSLGLMFGAAFAVPLTIENRSGQPLLVTPVGTFGKGGEAKKALLPTLLCQFPAIRGAQNGRFRLASGDSTTILYDMDDINFSEIVVEDERGVIRQYVADPEPTKNQYHGPSRARYILDDFGALPAAAPDVLKASGSPRIGRGAGLGIILFLITPWAAALLLEWSIARIDRSRAAAP